MSSVVTTVGLVQLELARAIDNKLGSSLVYVDSLDYRRAHETYRSYNDDGDPDPLLAIRRGPLEYLEFGTQRRSPSESVISDIKGFPDKKNILAKAHGQIRFEFEYYAKKISDLTEFEVLYATRQGLTSLREVKLEVPEELGGGSLPYFLDYQDLEASSFESSDNDYASVTSTFTIKGFFLVLTGSQERIKEINARINDINNTELLGAININA